MMNKYQSALTNLHNRAMEHSHIRKGQIIRQTKLLQKLVDNATPMKPIAKIHRVYECYEDTYGYDEEYYVCPVCGSDYLCGVCCCECRQALDWSEE